MKMPWNTKLSGCWVHSCCVSYCKNYPSVKNVAQAIKSETMAQSETADAGCCIASKEFFGLNKTPEV